MNAPQSHNHHYVPQWYQRQFLSPGSDKLYYLDLKPAKVRSKDITYMRKALYRWTPAQCFYQTDLYTMRLAGSDSDEIEKKLFGSVDKKGATAVRFFNAFSGANEGLREAFDNLLVYLGAQRFRTPHGLDRLIKGTGSADRLQVLPMLNNLMQAFDTMWMEGIWEIVGTKSTSSQFIISDGPVTFFNRRIVPGGYPYPGPEEFPLVGTRTIFPLGPTYCLVITHLQVARNPWNNPTEKRRNARSFELALKHLDDIQWGRQLEEDEVLRINLIIKRSATKYIAASDENFLYPERHVGHIHWTELDKDWFLFPNLWKVPFTTEIVMGFKSGARGMDEYGRSRSHPYHQDPGQRDSDRRRFREAKHEWARRRAGKSRTHVEQNSREDAIDDQMMDEFLERERVESSDAEE